MKDYIREILEEVNDIQVRYTKPSLERNYTDRDYAIGRYEKLVCKMIDIINNLQKENILLTNARYSLDRVKLEKRINTAIEYIENNQLYEDLTEYDDEINFSYVEDIKATKELLSILRGKE